MVRNIEIFENLHCDRRSLLFHLKNPHKTSSHYYFFSWKLMHRGLCREEGRSLSYLAARDDKPLDGFGLFGIVKETGVDDEGLFDFNKKYFKFPLFKDPDQNFYALVGNRKMGARALFGLIWNGKSVGKRWKEKGIESNLKGEGLKQGGVVIFGKDGKQKYIYQEVTGTDIPVNDILAAVNAVKEEK